MCPLRGGRLNHSSLRTNNASVNTAKTARNAAKAEYIANK